MENLSEDYRMALCDLEKIIESFEPELQAKIPQEFKNFVKDCKMPNYQSTYNSNVPPHAQKLNKTTASLLAIVYYNYLCYTKEEKDAFLNLFK